MGKRWIVCVALAALTAGIAVAPRRAEAQTSMAAMGQPHAFPQGMIGLGFVGAEAVILVEGAVGIRSPWILLGSGALGLIAGGIGGYFIDEAIESSIASAPMNNHSMLPMVSTGILAVGLGLIIPTAIMYVSATMYHPEDTHVETEDNTGNAPLEESTGGANTQTQSTTPAPAGGESGGAGGGGRSTVHRTGPEALLNVHDGHFRLGVPAVVIGPTYSLQEMQQFGVVPQTELRIPVLTATF